MYRFVLIDYLHLVYKTFVMPSLTCEVVYDNGERDTIDTVIPTATIKDTWRFSANGKYMTGVFLEGGAPLRKEYFRRVAAYREFLEAQKQGTAVSVASAASGSASAQNGYKASRGGLNDKQREGVNIAVNLMLKGGVSCYQMGGYEADDLIFTMYKQLRTAYPDAIIDIITGDMDMLPMCDERTNIYMRGNRTFGEPLCQLGLCTNQKDTCDSYANDTCKLRREFKGYYQVTPDNWDEFISYRSAFKGFNIPYNAIYLLKMLRGDTSDEVPSAEKGWGAKKWNKLIEQMQADNVDFARTFRYTTPWKDMEAILLKYLPAETVNLMRLNAEGIRPRSCMGELINLMPIVNTNNEPLDLNMAKNVFLQNGTYQPRSQAEYERALIAFDCLRNNVDITNTLSLLIPKQPVLGHLQPSVSALKINLSTASLPY